MATAVVGKDVDSWCTRCRLVLAHTVEAMIGDKITRVHCNTCGAQHAYRPHPPGVAAQPHVPAARRGATPPRPRPGNRPDLAELLRGRDLAARRRYAITERFTASDVIEHPTFGVGIVLGAKEANKIEVLFSDGPKMLVHGRT